MTRNATKTARRQRVEVRTSKNRKLRVKVPIARREKPNTGPTGTREHTRSPTSL